MKNVASARASDKRGVRALGELACGVSNALELGAPTGLVVSARSNTCEFDVRFREQSSLQPPAIPNPIAVNAHNDMRVVRFAATNRGDNTWLMSACSSGNQKS